MITKPKDSLSHATNEPQQVHIPVRHPNSLGRASRSIDRPLLYNDYIVIKLYPDMGSFPSYFPIINMPQTAAIILLFDACIWDG